jgi:hypothetical protein
MWLCLQQIFEMRSHCGCLWLNDRCRRREARCQPCAKHRRFPLPPGDRPRISPYFRRGRHNQHLFVLVPITQTTQVRSRNVHQYDDRASMTGVSWFSTRRTRPVHGPRFGPRFHPRASPLSGSFSRARSSGWDLPTRNAKVIEHAHQEQQLRPLLWCEFDETKWAKVSAQG